MFSTLTVYIKLAPGIGKDGVAVFVIFKSVPMMRFMAVSTLLLKSKSGSEVGLLSVAVAVFVISTLSTL